MKMIRAILSFLVLAWDRTFVPKAPSRTAEEQQRLDEETRSLKLYQFEACPFCVKVRRQIQRLGLNIEIRDILKEKAFETELIQGGGERQVPCLRIEEGDGKIRWLYESSDINRYLAERFPVKGV